MLNITWIPESILTEVVLVSVAFVLSAVIGVERQRQLKDAGLRTHTIVGLGSALFTLVSAYGFSNVIGEGVILDPSRIAAQIVSGIGFLGAGVIFVRQNAVSGLTTAASIWVTAAIGMACGAGMPVIAAVATALYLVAAVALSFVGSRIPSKRRGAEFTVTYRDNRGALRRILASATALGYETSLVDTRKIEEGRGDVIEAGLRFSRSKPPVSDDLMEALVDVRDVVSVNSADTDD